MLSIGVVLKGPELARSKIDRALSAAAKAAIEFRKDFEFGSSPAINVVFHVPGSMGSPDWRGLRDAKFSRKLQLLMIQVAVPKGVVESANLEDFVSESLHEANTVALHFFKRKGLNFSLEVAEQFVAIIECNMENNGSH